MAEDSNAGPKYDVAVIGAGPAGSSAAIAAASRGARVILLDRAIFPRYKTCGGGLIGLTLSSLPQGFQAPIREEITRASFSIGGRRVRNRKSEAPILSLVNRDEFDEALVQHAISRGVTFQPGTSVSKVVELGGHCEITTENGVITASTVVGADGSASRMSRLVGVKMDQVDLGLEVELEAEPCASDWHQKVHLDWGHTPGSYAWVFPKGDSLTVGVISRKGTPVDTKKYLEDFLVQQGLQDHKVISDAGHLTRCRNARSALGRGRILLAGDAAGLLEPWTREGISFALRSGRMAGDTLATAVQTGMSSTAIQSTYASRIEGTLGLEMAAGAECLRAFERFPAVFHLLIGGTRLGWREFCRITRGTTTLAQLSGHRTARWGLKALSIGAGSAKKR